MAYHSFFALHLWYDMVGQDPATATNIESILIIQKKAVRTLFGLGYQEHCKPYLTHYEDLTVISQYILETTILVVNSYLTLRIDQHNILSHSFSFRDQTMHSKCKYLRYLFKNFKFPVTQAKLNILYFRSSMWMYFCLSAIQFMLCFYHVHCCLP